ncbi:MAG TPA: serine/threonine-protein kinase [Pseudobdellovibrionaceae bacterium]|nr:serine/threonine-protein kinase [Pseudobdellovibrionaceae bacterium]
MSADSQLRAGLQIGDYELESELGRGGMGVVFRARDLTLKRVVALKLLPIQDLGGQDLLQRFLLEGRALAQLRHPQIVSVYSLGHVDGYAYIAMECLEGNSLHVLSRRRLLSPLDALQIFADIAEGLHHAHKSGIVHRDVKPGNIIVDHSGSSKLIDFGIAKLSQQDDEMNVRTETGVLIGTLNYIAPELFRGAPPSAQTDLYALGLVLYEMLVGRTPFRGQNRFETMELIRKAELPVGANLRAAVPKAVWDLIRSCTRPDPRERPQDLAEAAARARAIDWSSAPPACRVRQMAQLVTEDQLEKAQQIFKSSGLMSTEEYSLWLGDWVNSSVRHSKREGGNPALNFPSSTNGKTGSGTNSGSSAKLPPVELEIATLQRRIPSFQKVYRENSTQYLLHSDRMRRWWKPLAAGAAAIALLVGFMIYKELLPMDVVEASSVTPNVAPAEAPASSTVNSIGNSPPAEKAATGSLQELQHRAGLIHAGDPSTQIPTPNPRIGDQYLYIIKKNEGGGRVSEFYERRIVEGFEGHLIRWRMLSYTSGQKPVFQTRPEGADAVAEVDRPDREFYWWTENVEFAMPRKTKNCPSFADFRSEERGPSTAIFPLQVGREVVFDTKAFSMELPSEGLIRTRRCRIEGPEKVVVPAGEFETLRADCEVESRGRKAGQLRSVHWNRQGGEVVLILRQSSQGYYSGPYGSRQELIEIFRGSGETYAEHMARTPASVAPSSESVPSQPILTNETASNPAP